MLPVVFEEQERKKKKELRVFSQHVLNVKLQEVPYHASAVGCAKWSRCLGRVCPSGSRMADAELQLNPTGFVAKVDSSRTDVESEARDLISCQLNLARGSMN